VLLCQHRRIAIETLTSLAARRTDEQTV
jgi:hypothetical protein